ncbi:unnamed protein product [Larinioides sclopetarius]|uniref:Uncharacterized protein n=1 Tax=Larinioides sclopetarius TaxID=280406 RepID=A0AAV2ACJ3_9ARAC
MDVFNFCWRTLLDESNKCCVFFDKNTCNVQNNIDQNFAKPVSRIAYLYKFGSYNISFFYQCFKEFFTKVPDSSKIIDNLRGMKNLTICSMSAGPGTDIIGLLYSLYLVQKPLMNSTIFRVISKDGNWRNLVTQMINSSIISVPDGSACHLIGCNFLKKLSNKAQIYLKTADILLMCDSFSSSETKEIKICNTLKMTIELLKPGVLVFLVFSKVKLSYFNELNSFGSFLYGPVDVTLEGMAYNEEIAELVGVKPLCSGMSTFAVWQKFHKTNPEKNVGMENSLDVGSDQQSSTKDINSPILSMSDLKREFSSDSFASSSQSSSSSISGQIKKSTEKPVVPGNLVDFNVQNIGFPEIQSSAKKISPVSLSTSASSSCGNSQNKGKDMDSLLKNFESLITKFEGLINSWDSSKKSYLKEKQSSSCQHYHQNLHQGHYIKQCQFNENGSTCCCHSMVCDNNINAATHNCFLNVANNMYRTLPQEGPSIVIPLQNLSNESLIHILSIISQNCSSVNKTST